MKKLILISILIFPFFSFSQTEEDTTVYTVVEKMPEFPGGEEKLYEYLAKNIEYSECYTNPRTSFREYCQFIVEKDGSISNVKIFRGNNKSPCKSNTIEIIKNMPKWISGKKNGKIVRVKYVLPIIFNLK